MAPEQWEGKAGPQSDQYALGAAFFELLTGRKPYIADTSAALMVKHITEPLPSFQSLVPGLPAEVEFIVSKQWQKRALSVIPVWPICHRTGRAGFGNLYHADAAKE